MEEVQSIFEKLCLPHLDAAYNFARLVVERDQDAEDVVQEAYVRALKGFEKFHGNDARAWLLGIVRNAAYGRLQKHVRKSDLLPFETTIDSETVDDPLPDSYHEERVQQLDEALKRLPVELREILFLREIEDWSYRKLASTLKVSSETVVSRLSRARQCLQQELARAGRKELKHEL
ncbi:MAG: sigma-70 family RNA polymerase sigma factor [Verrucomicrobia bacterium]|nr:sigma-70 family RNA polymerase sigma factor [Verrucomicrobiota bacterium]